MTPSSSQASLADARLGSPTSANEALRRHGYAFFPGLWPAASGEDVANLLGTLWNRRNLPHIHRITPLPRHLAGPNTYSGLYGLHGFPFHSDLAHWRFPPRFIMLRCVVGFPEVPTLLLDGTDLIASVGSNSLTRSLVRPRSPHRGKLPLLQLYHQLQYGENLFRWDEIFLQPASKAGHHGSMLLKNAIASSVQINISLSAAGDTLLIDNWRMLHSRSPIPVGYESRVLERAYLESVS